jgi:hypothetical protein
MYRRKFLEIKNGLGYLTLLKPNKFVQFPNGLILGCPIPAWVDH